MDEMEPAAGGIGVVHLVREQNGLAPLQRFLDSYRKEPPGVSHDLILVFKGFARKRLPREYEKLLVSVRHDRLFVQDSGYDISSYFIAARSLQYTYLCFLNSFSVILTPEWLLKLYSHAAEDQVGIVGATGSYQSIYSDVDLAKFEKVRRPFMRRVLLRFFPFLSLVRLRVLLLIYRKLFDPFPNYHIRTNGFMMRRDTLLRVRRPRLWSKLDAYVFESGKSGLTKQILGMGKSCLVIGRDGKSYSRAEWHRSNTFWQAHQENLLIADNQTNLYQHGSVEVRTGYSNHAWGRDAKASPPKDAASELSVES